MGRASTRHFKTSPAARWSSILGCCALGAGCIVGLSFSCTGPGSRVPSPKAAPAEPRDSVASAEEEKAEADTLTGSYAEAIRRRQFQRAAWLIDSASETERKSPEVRYARAQVALELNDVETALRQVAGLEEAAPLFEAEAQEVRKQAARQSHDISLLSAFLGERPTTEDLLVLSRAQLQSTSPVAGRRVADQALKQLEGKEGESRAQLRAEARALRAESFRLEGNLLEAAKEFQWLAEHAPEVMPQTLGYSRSFEEEMRALNPELTLSREVRKKRARAFSDDGRVDETAREVEAIESEGTPLMEGTGLLAWAVYVSRTDYVRASELFALAAEKEPKERTRYLYYEAKALARSHRDSEAVSKYEVVSKRSHPYAEHAAFQAARLRFIDGQWAASVDALSSYLRTYGSRGRHADDARYHRAVARLAAAQYQAAASELRELREETQNPRTRAQLMQLQAVGLWGAGRTKEATAMLHEVIDARPLSFAALLAEARLRAYGQQVPARILPGSSPDASTTTLALTLPEKVWRLHRVGLDAEAEAALREHEPALRQKFGLRYQEALCRLYGQLQSARRRYQIAQYAAKWEHLRLAPNSATVWEWNCIYPKPYGDVVEHHAELHKVPPALIYGIMRQESAFRPTVVSPADAVGLMQVIPPTAARIAAELDAEYDPDAMRSPATNVRFGAYYLRRLLDMFGQRPELAAAAYNAGPHALSRWLRAGETLPLDLFVARIPYRETREYVYRVMDNLARYTYLHDPDQVPVFDLTLPTGLRAPDDAY